jgi:hypothetical protein
LFVPLHLLFIFLFPYIFSIFLPFSVSFFYFSFFSLFLSPPFFSFILVLVPCVRCYMFFFLSLFLLLNPSSHLHTNFKQLIIIFLLLGTWTCHSFETIQVGDTFFRRENSL